MDHLDIHHDDQLLLVACKFISGLHGVPSGIHTEHQMAMLSTWRQPSWVKHKTYDKTVSEAKIEGGPLKASGSATSCC
jgi:hypothetical protein